MEARLDQLEALLRHEMQFNETRRQEMQQESKENFATLNARFDQLFERRREEEEPRFQLINDNPRNRQPDGHHGNPRIKIDFPRFRGDEDPTTWVCRAEQFFEFYGTPEEEKVLLASIYLEGEAQLWLQVLKDGDQQLTWDDMKRGLHTRFGPTQFEDFFGELTKLRQTGSVRDYQSQFEKLLVRAGRMTQAQQVSCFMSGLKLEIRTDVQVCKPATLTTAIGLARLYEDRSRVVHQGMRFHNTPRGNLLIKRLNPAEVNERRAKGLCFNCNERFGSPSL
ncbi:unnamed protein product [Linum trigynum]|uniref:Retrotransposon gag domain-containing protein n=1 Tax=Linum trigynum TaxID=586398 RepID=A0AAV2FCJ2_9ROSI